MTADSGPNGLRLGLTLVALAALGAPAVASPAQADGPRSASGGSGVVGVTTPRRAELRETVPITERPGAEPRSVVSLPLPPIRRGDRIRFNGEVTLTTTCVGQKPRCIGRRYGFDPHLRARVVLAGDRDDAGGGTMRLARAPSLGCEQTRPNRNHHCPLVIERGSFSVDQPGELPCRPEECRLNLVVDASHRNAQGGEVVVVGADRPDGSVEGDKARLSAVTKRAGSEVQVTTRSTSTRRTRKLPASFSRGHRVVYSQALGRLRGGDVLLIRARQRTAIRLAPYFVAAQVVISTRRDGTHPSNLASRVISRSGTATETNGFNCTLGPSAFRTPCLTTKAGMAIVERAPRTRRGTPRKLYVNLVSRAFPKLSQARGSYPPARILRGGGLVVKRLRAGSTGG